MLERHSAGGVRLIAVMFADREPDWTVVRALAASGFAGVMLDTAGKDRGGLLEHLRIGLIADFLAEARRCGLIAGLAGSRGPGTLERCCRSSPMCWAFAVRCAPGECARICLILRASTLCAD